VRTTGEGCSEPVSNLKRYTPGCKFAWISTCVIGGLFGATKSAGAIICHRPSSRRLSGSSAEQRQPRSRIFTWPCRVSIRLEGLSRVHEPMLMSVLQA